MTTILNVGDRITTTAPTVTFVGNSDYVLPVGFKGTITQAGDLGESVLMLADDPSMLPAYLTEFNADEGHPVGLIELWNDESNEADVWHAFGPSTCENIEGLPFACPDLNVPA